MVERLIGKLLEEDIGTITLYAEPTVTGLYEKLSFVQDPQGIKVNVLAKAACKCQIRTLPVKGFASIGYF